MFKTSIYLYTISSGVSPKLSAGLSAGIYKAFLSLVVYEAKQVTSVHFASVPLGWFAYLWSSLHVPTRRFPTGFSAGPPLDFLEPSVLLWVLGHHSPLPYPYHPNEFQLTFICHPTHFTESMGMLSQIQDHFYHSFKKIICVISAGYPPLTTQFDKNQKRMPASITHIIAGTKTCCCCAKCRRRGTTRSAKGIIGSIKLLLKIIVYWKSGFRHKVHTFALLSPIQIPQLYSELSSLHTQKRHRRLDRNTLLLCQKVVVKKTSLGCIGHTAFVSSGLIFVSPDIGLSQAAWLWCTELPDAFVQWTLSHSHMPQKPPDTLPAPAQNWPHRIEERKPV